MVKGVWLCPSLYDMYKQQTSVNKEEEEEDNNNDNNDNDDNDTNNNNNSNNNDDDDDGDDINCPTSFLALCKDFFFFSQEAHVKAFSFCTFSTFMSLFRQQG